MSNPDSHGIFWRCPTRGPAEVVVFKPSPMFFASLGCCFGILAGIIAVFVELSAWFVVNPSIENLPKIYLILAIAFGTTVATTFLGWKRYEGRELRVSNAGIETTIGGDTFQKCKWRDMTIKVKGRGWRRQVLLCDQDGLEFRLFGLDSTHPDHRLAILAMRTHAKKLAEQLPKGARDPRLSWWLLVPLFLVGGLGMVLLKPATVTLVELVESPSSTTQQRAQAMAVVLGGALLAAIGALALELSAIPAMIWMIKKSRTKSSCLSRFIDEQKGFLPAVELTKDVPYRYIAPKELRSQEGMLAAGWILAGFALLLAGAFGSSIPSNPTARDPATIVVMILAVGYMGGLGAFMLQRGFRLRRGLDCEYRAANGAIMVTAESGHMAAYTVVKKSKQNRASRTTPGNVWWLLRSASDKPILVDPRYLVPVEDEVS